MKQPGLKAPGKGGEGSGPCAFICRGSTVYSMSLGIATVPIGPFELYEAVILLFLFAGLVPMTLRVRWCRVKWFYAAYVAFFAGMVASILEYEALALLEHNVGIAAAGFLFWWTAMTGAAEAKREGSP